MLSNLVNGLCAIASGTPRKKEDTLSGKLSEGRVSFEDALSHIYPETAPRAQAPDSISIYEASPPPESPAVNQSLIRTSENLPMQSSPSFSSGTSYDKIQHVQAQLAQQILGNYAETVSPIRRDFLENMTSVSAEFLAARSRPAPPQSVPSRRSVSMQGLVDRVFNILEPYIHELNNTFRATDLSLTFTPPAAVNESLSYDTLRRPSLVISSYRCRISTSRLSLVVRGREDRVDFFLLPVDRVMGLSAVEDQHQPLMTFTAEAQGGVIYWEVEGKALTDDRLERYLLLVFEHLMELTREELMPRPAFVGAV